MSGTTYVRPADTVVSVTFSTNTNAYASGDLIADTQAVAAVAQYTENDTVVLKSITLLDKADQKVALYFVFLNAATSMGTENDAPSISDTAAEGILAVVPIAEADYLDVGGAAVVTKECAIPLRLLNSTSLYVAIVNAAGTPTYAAASLVAKFGFLR